MLNSVTVSGTRSVGTSRTSVLLVCGAISGPMFIATSFVQALTRTGFDLTRHPPSLLSLGDLGWIQIANFVICGLLFVAAAIGLRRASASKWGSVLIGAVGAAMVVGGVFVVDSGLGFPAGAPAGEPSTMSWHAAVHLTAFAIGFVSLVAACAIFARWQWRAGMRGWAAYSATVAIVTGACFAVFMSGLSRGNLVPLWLALLVGWTWASAVATGTLLGRGTRRVVPGIPR